VVYTDESKRFYHVIGDALFKDLFRLVDTAPNQPCKVELIHAITMIVLALGKDDTR